MITIIAQYASDHPYHNSLLHRGSSAFGCIRAIGFKTRLGSCCARIVIRLNALDNRRVSVAPWHIESRSWDGHNAGLVPRAAPVG